jgi:hypothetical protein
MSVKAFISTLTDKYTQPFGGVHSVAKRASAAENTDQSVDSDLLMFWSKANDKPFGASTPYLGID